MGSIRGKVTLLQCLKAFPCSVEARMMTKPTRTATSSLPPAERGVGYGISKALLHSEKHILDLLFNENCFED